VAASNRQRLALCLLTGLLTGVLWTLSLPKFDMGWLAWICLTPTLYLLFHLEPTSRETWYLGAAAGLSAGIGRVYWVSETLQNYGGLNAPAAYMTTLLLAAYVGAYPLLVVRISRQFARHHLRLYAWLVAALWVLLDWVLSWAFTGFPWALIGYSQYQTPIVLQVAALTGVHGLSFILVAANAGLAQLLGSRRSSWSIPPLILPLAVGLLLTSLCVDSPPPLQTMRVGIVQGSVDQSTKWNRVSLTQTTGTHLRLARQLHREGQQDLIVFPETAFPFRLDHPNYEIHRRWLFELAQELDTSLLVGSLGSSSEQGAAGLYNRAFLINADGRIGDYADKVHLVPFGEYLPMKWIFGYLDELTAESGAFDPGQMGHKILRLTHGVSTTPFAVFICYESIFPQIARQQTLAGAQFLINTTNDGWFGTTSAPAQHLSMAVLRAVENGRAVVRAANTGISCLIDPRGAIDQPTVLFTQTTVHGEIELRDALTPYTQLGDVIVVICALITGIGVVLWVRRRQNRIETELRGAREQLTRWAHSPVPLRHRLVLLPGYDSDASVYAPLLDAVQRSFTQVEGAVTAIDLRHDLSIAALTAHVDGLQDRDDPRPVAFVGHSLGGLVCVSAAAELGRTDTQVITIASPFGGTRFATLARWWGRDCPATLLDLGARSQATTAIQQIVQLRPVDLSLRLCGDPLSRSPDPAQVAVSYPPALLVHPRTRHTLVLQDPRVLRDVIGFLRQ
jgi:apolipoprotein N-acyltransferase